MSETKKKRKTVPVNPNMSDLEPGTKVMMGKILRKVPWTKRKVEERYPMVSLLPEISDIIIWNGVRYDVIEGVETSIPRPHYDEYMARRKAEHRHGGAVQIIGGQAIGVQYAAGLEGFSDDPERGKLNIHTLGKQG